MSARTDTRALMQQFGARGISLSFDEVNTLRRAQLTLQRWAALECGDENDWASWAIERDDQTDIPYMVTYPHTGESRRHRIPDKENGALARVTVVCEAHGLHFYHQIRAAVRSM